MRKLISYFIKYPVAVNIIIIAFFLLGVLGYSSLKSSFFPLTDSKIITVNLVYPGASPQEVEVGVVLLIESNLKGVVGVDRVTSTSSENSALITVEIDTDYDIDVVLADVKNAVDKVPNYPVGMEPPVVSKVETTAQSISFAISGDNIPLTTLKNTARDIEADLLRIDGLSQVNLSGFPSEEIEIAVKESDLRAYNITFQDVSNAIARANLITTGGSVKTDTEEYLIRANNRKYYANELDYLIVKTLPNGTIVRIKDVATVSDKFNETPNASYFNGNPSVTVEVSNTNNEDLMLTAENVRNYIDEFNKTHNNIQLSITRDSSITLEQRTKLLFENASVGMLLVFVFLALF